MMIADCKQKINDEYMVMEMPNEAESNLPDLIKKLMKGDCCPDYRVRLKWQDLLDVLFYLDRLKNISEMPKLGKKPDYISLNITDLIDMIGEPVYIKDEGSKGRWEIVTAVRKTVDGEDICSEVMTNGKESEITFFGQKKAQKMKTLDEVIKILENVVMHNYVWFDDKTALMTIETLTDILQYLRELQDMTNVNNPLTWDELRLMEGKPVWFESVNYYEEYQIGEKDCPIKYDKEECWVIIDKVWSGNVKFKQINGRILRGWRRVKGKAWEVYRKERK